MEKSNLSAIALSVFGLIATAHAKTLSIKEYATNPKPTFDFSNINKPQS